MKKKMHLIVMLVCMLALALAGCKNSDDDAVPAPAELVAVWYSSSATNSEDYKFQIYSESAVAWKKSGESAPTFHGQLTLKSGTGISGVFTVTENFTNVKTDYAFTTSGVQLVISSITGANPMGASTSTFYRKPGRN
jgi:uncharacterized secreted protein with C-terminal beta-propeller domain